MSAKKPQAPPEKSEPKPAAPPPPPPKQPDGYWRQQLQIGAEYRAELQRRCDKLQAENERLREEVRRIGNWAHAMGYHGIRERCTQAAEGSGG